MWQIASARAVQAGSRMDQTNGSSWAAALARCSVVMVSHLPPIISQPGRRILVAADRALPARLGFNVSAGRNALHVRPLAGVRCPARHAPQMTEFRRPTTGTVINRPMDESARRRCRSRS